MEDIIKIFGGSFIAGLIITALINVFNKHGFGLVNIVKNTFGALFLFSATVKAIDPTGTAIKMSEYFEELHLVFMHPFSLTFSVIMIVLEFLLGLALIMGWRNRLTLGLLILMNVFFTFLTGFTTVTGKVTDCGCFGDFIKQTPMESFIKDLILLALLWIIFLGRKKIKELFTDSKGLIILGFIGLGFLYFNFANFYFDKPIVDFRPYAVGKDINAQRVEIADKLDYGFQFKELSSGKLKRVPMGEYAKFKADIAWEFTGEQDNIILEKGIPAVIANYAAFNEDGDEITDELLMDEGYSIWVLTKNVDESHNEAWSKIEVIQNYAQNNSIRMYAFTSSVFETTNKFKHKHGLSFPFYEADETLIKTVVRANPGVLLLKNGIVLGKWQHKHIPEVNELSKLMNL
jgi:hypothetical protein